VDGLRVELDWPPVVTLERLRIGNPDWAATPDLVDARGVRARVEVAPLFERRLVVPYLGASEATAGLEQDGERATWRFGPGDAGESPFTLSRVFIERGRVAYRHAQEKTALDVDVAGSAGEAGELEFAATGRFRGEPARANVRIPSLDPSLDTPVRLAGDALVGRTKIGVDGTIAGTLATLDVALELAGPTLRELTKVFGTNLPDTPPYRVKGRLRRDAGEWVFEPFEGRVGDSDLAGQAAYRTGAKRPLFRAVLSSKVLDLDDLGPVVGTPPKAGPRETASAGQTRKAAMQADAMRVLPQQRFSTAGWEKMDADVRLSAKRLLRPDALPLDSLSTHVVLNDRLLKLDPLSFGVAGGRVSGPVVVDARETPPRGDFELDVQGLDLARLFPKLESTRQSIGTLYGRAKLAGRGDTIAALLGTSDGSIALAIDAGSFSLLLVELLGLDVAEAVQLLGTRNRQVKLRCAVADLAVKDGVATPRAFVIDTTDTVVTVAGTIDFARERLDLVFHPEPKDPSIFALRSPIHLEGPFKQPKVRPDAGPIVARVVAAAALAALNPVLALIPFIETGPGKDTDCGALVAQARSKGATRRTP
jgi:uncharacterized protein involved in outer membrane biogenesis